MANDIFNEVDESVKEEEFAKWLKKYGPKLIALSLIVVLFTVGRVVYSNYKNSKNESQTVILNDIAYLKSDDVDQIKAKAQELDANHKFLADFMTAGAYAEKGELVEANKIYEEILKDRGVSEEYKRIASIYIAQNILNMNDGNLDRAKELISPMLNKEDSFYYIVMEYSSIIELKKGNIEEAKKILAELSDDVDAPSKIIERSAKLKTLF